MKTRKKSEASGVAFAASSVQSTSLESQLQAFVRFQQRAKLCSWRPHKKPSNAVNLSFVRNESFWVPCSRETQGKVIWSHRQVNFDRVLRDAKSHSVEHCWAQQNCGCWTTLFRYWVFMSVYEPSSSIALFLGKFHCCTVGSLVMFVMFVVPHLAGVLAWDQDEDVGLSADPVICIFDCMHQIMTIRLILLIRQVLKNIKKMYQKTGKM